MQYDVTGPADGGPASQPWRWITQARGLGRDALAGLVAAVVLIANIVSFGALMFPGPLAAGTPTAIWAMLVGACVGGVWIAATSSIPPLATGIDSPTGAVLVLLSAAAAPRVIAAGGSVAQAVEAVMLIFTAATVLCGLLLWGLGRLRLASSLRFVPYFVVAGFLAATGWFLIAGGLHMATGHGVGARPGAWSAAEAARLAAALGTLAVLLAMRRWVKWGLALPVALLGLWGIGVATLKALGLSGPQQGWYLPSLGALRPWWPWAAEARLDAAMLLRLAPELLAAAIVALVSLVTKVSSLEVARKCSGDLDRELRGHGVAALAAAPLGGLVSSLQTGTSRLLEHAGGGRLSGVVCALILGTVAVAHFDLPALVPIPIVAGLVFYLGYSFIVDALAKPLAQRAWLDLLLAVAIMAVCVRFGYLAGVLGGVVGACLLFAVSYARIGVVRRHLSRAQYTSHVSRSAEATRQLAASGDAIQLYWLSGYIFFGSSESVFERVREDMRALPARRVRSVILDFALVSGVDASATVSLAKLRNFCRQQGSTLLFSAMSPAIQAALQREAFFGGPGQGPAFADMNQALAWAEDRLLESTPLGAEPGLAGFEPWLQQQLGEQVRAADFMAYLQRRDVAGAEVLYRQGEPADAIDLVAAGRLAVDIAGDAGQALRVRSISTHSVVGEMGFFRRLPRSATVSSDGPATVFTLTRPAFERLRRERPDLACAFDDFLLRVLADRISLSERLVIALGR